MGVERGVGTYYGLNDGLGERRIEVRPPHGHVEVLHLTPALASHASVEPAIRTRAARLSDVDVPAFASARRVDTDDEGVRVVSDRVEGIRLMEVLQRLEAGREPLPESAMLELAAGCIRAVAVLHRLPGGFAHGAITPAHIVLTADRTVVLTDGVFGAALESLHWNRERLWRVFGVALPATAGVPRFDQRADVTQLGAVVLALALRRPLRAEEYPRVLPELIGTATADPAMAGAAALRTWLQQAFQLQPRSTFATAVEAELAFSQIRAQSGSRRAGARALNTLLAPPHVRMHGTPAQASRMLIA